MSARMRPDDAARGGRVALVAALLTFAGVPAAAQMATAERVELQAWWPTKQVPRDAHVGPEACAACHLRQASTQRSTSMARTGGRASDSPILRDGKELAFRSGAFTYRITRSGGDAVYAVSDGTTTRAAELAWAFGAGRVGQSFLFERDGALHEARVSYYDAVGALDFTPNRGLGAPRDVDDAMSRPVLEGELRRCFACHTTASGAPDGVAFGSLMPGITCEACHGPGRAHATAMAQGRVSEGRAAIFDPRRLDAVDAVDFCGSCHATFWDVTLANERGIAALRSQPYRLQSSRCWSKGDRRITCVACHDPHQPLVGEASAYDARCTSCHVPGSGSASVRVCRVGSANCSTCHMPKYEVPGMHFEFTDHLIRVVRDDRR